MAQRLTKAQVAARYREQGIMAPTRKMDPEELQAHLRQRSATFASAKGKERRSRSNSKRCAIRAAY